MDHLPKTDRGQNRHDHPIRIRYRYKNGDVLDTNLVLYAVGIAKSGNVSFSGYSEERRDRMRFSSAGVERLTDRRTGESWTAQDYIKGYLLDFYQRQL